MTDTETAVGGVQPETAANGSTETEEENGEEETAGVSKRYFPPDTLATEAQPYVNLLSQRDDVTFLRNFDPNKDFPAGYGLAVVPVSRRKEDGDGNELVAIVFAAIPDPSTVASHEKGQAFIRNTILDRFMAQVANCARPKKDGTTSDLPFDVVDFLETRVTRGTLKAYTEIAPIFVKALKKKGIPFLTPVYLRQLLQCAAFAESKLPTISQENWVAVLNAMIGKAAEKGHDPAVLISWRDTRDSMEMTEVAELDLSDLGDLV